MQPPRIPAWILERVGGRIRAGAPSRPTLQALTGILLLFVASMVVANPAMATTNATDDVEDPSIEIEYDGDKLALEPAPNQTIRGTSTFENGTDITVRIRSSGENPFIKSRGTTVGPDGSWSVSFDFSGIDPVPIQVTARADNGNVTTELDGRIGAPQTATTRQTLDLPTETTVEYGDTAMLSLSIPAGDSAILAIGSESAGYRVVVRVADATEDATVTVTFDTAAAGSADPTVGVQGADRFEVLEPEPALNGSLPGGSYDLSLATDAERDPIAIGSLVVDGAAVTTTMHPDEPDAPTNVIPPLSDPFWRTTAPGLAGLLAVLSGLASLLVSRR